MAKAGRLKLESEIEITEWGPFNMYSYEGSNGNLHAAGKVRFEPKENGTQVTMNAQIKGVGFARLLEGLVGRQAEKQDSSNYDALKLLLEAS